MPEGSQSTAVIYSGGTDSTCAAALAAERHARVHLLTYFELATRRAVAPSLNIEVLRTHYPAVEFVPCFTSVDNLVRFFSYDQYARYLWKHKALVLANCGFSSLSWHVRSIVYCLEQGISTISDGLTRELMHFPGHMEEVVEVFRDLYRHFGIAYTNPVRDWEVPVDHQFLDQLIVNTHGGDYRLSEEDNRLRKTTGRYLHERGILPKPNVKGSAMDRLMQQDCYPFAIYNIMVFWCYLSHEPYGRFCQRMRVLFTEKSRDAIHLIEEHGNNPRGSRLAALLAR